jgi:hypothetical protein
MSDVDDFEAAGLYDPNANDAQLRLEVLRFFTDDVGASIPEIVQALEEDRLLSMAAFRTIRPGGQRLTLTQIAERAGLSVTLAAQVWRAAGFPVPRPFERRFGDTDISFLETIRIAVSSSARTRRCSSRTSGFRVRPGCGSGDRAAAVTYGGTVVRGREVRRSRAQLPGHRGSVAPASSTPSTHSTATRSKPSAAGTPVPAHRSRTSFRSRSGSRT